MDIRDLEFDPDKRAQTLLMRGLDFLDCPKVFAGPHWQIEDDRQDYGELRYILFGWLDGRRVAIVWTPRNGRRRIISMRYAHVEEFAAYHRSLD